MKNYTWSGKYNIVPSRTVASKLRARDTRVAAGALHAEYARAHPTPPRGDVIDTEIWKEIYT